MIRNHQLTITSLDQLSPLPQFDAAWTTRYPLYQGKSVGRYMPPADKNGVVKGVMLSGGYADSAANTGRFGAAMPLGVVRLLLDGTPVAEFRRQWVGSTYSGAPTGISDWGGAPRNISGMLGTMDLAAGQVLSVTVDPDATTGLIPQTVWRVQLYLSDLAGQDLSQFARVITTSGDTGQILFSYTVPPGGARFKCLDIFPTSVDIVLGVAQLLINGQVVLETPMITADDGRTIPFISLIPLFDGLTLHEGDSVEMTAACFDTLGQRLQFLVWGDEPALAAPGGNGGISRGRLL